MAEVEQRCIDDEDLEDGEIESDEECEEVKSVEPVTSEPAKKEKIDETNDVKNSVKNKKRLDNDDVAKDDWMGDVENALAKALQKDGITPKPVKISSKNNDPKDIKDEHKVSKDTKDQQKEAKSESSSKSSKHKRKIEKTDRDSQRKKAKLDRPHHANESEDFDDYEMMNVRGGSPVPQSNSQYQNSQNLHKLNAPYYDSDSCSSNDSDAAEQRRQNRVKRRKERRDNRGGHSKRDQKRRRSDDSDDVKVVSNINRNNSTGGGGGGGGGGGDTRGNYQLCKFYILERCAKGENCSYMHGDFPCKYYYLGMKNHNRENCKFSHGKPLTDQLRAVLLKHIETAPKDILGDFPRIARENAVQLIDAQHQKLLVKFGMAPEPSTINATNASQASKIPSLLDINVDKFQLAPSSEHALKKDKQRKSRWCDQQSSDSNTNVAPNQSANESDIKLSSFTDILTAEQLEKLAKMGIETVSKISQLTILQVMELGLEIKVITELQLKAAQLQQEKQLQSQQQELQQQKSPQKSQTKPHNPFSTRSKETLSQDQDMRIPLNPVGSTDQLELANKDVDMRILVIPPQPGLDHSKSDNFSKNTQSEKTSEQASASRKTIDYSQYLKDANIDLNQSDLDDPLVNEYSKSKKDEYDSDEDESNSLVIEEENDQTQTEESNVKNDESGIQKNNDGASDFNSQASTYYDSQRDKSEASSSPEPSADSAIENILPAYYPSTSMYPTTITNKIDLSSSVSQLLKEDIAQKTDSYVKKVDSGINAVGNDSPRQSSTSFYSRQIPETNHPTPLALDEKPSSTVDYDSPSETNTRKVCSSPEPEKPVRKSIYDMSSDDDDYQIRSPSDSENKNTFSLSKDRDMRIPPIFLEKDVSNGDIDLRLPFKPIMDYYVPATEIDASITSHPPITYQVKLVYIPKPDYSALRKNTSKNTSDPRLRRILGLKENSSETETIANPSPFSPTHEPEFGESTPSITKVEPVNGDPRRRTDPRRKPDSIAQTTTTNTNPFTLNKPPPRSVHLDIQNILQKSNWYNECNSKQKIMVNQQLAIVSTELKKFHADPSENKIFDLSFINQNQLLQGVLTNLGIFINDDGEFVHLEQSNLGGNSIATSSASMTRTSSGQQQSLVDLMSIPIDMDYLRNKQQQHDVQRQQQAATLQAINALGGPRFLGPAAAQVLGLGPPAGFPPNIRLNSEAFNIMRDPRENAAWNQNYAGNANNSGGGGGGGKNRRKTGGQKRNQNFDRNNSRRK